MQGERTQYALGGIMIIFYGVLLVILFCLVVYANFGKVSDDTNYCETLNEQYIDMAHDIQGLAKRMKSLDGANKLMFRLESRVEDIERSINGRI